MVDLVGALRPAVRVDTGLVARQSAEFLLHVLQNVESNAELKGSDIDSLVIEHIWVNKEPKISQRIYRAQDRINLYLRSPYRPCPTTSR